MKKKWEEKEKEEEEDNVIVKLQWFVNLMIWNLLFTLICLWRWWNVVGGFAVSLKRKYVVNEEPAKK